MSKLLFLLQVFFFFFNLYVDFFFLFNLLTNFTLPLHPRLPPGGSELPLGHFHKDLLSAPSPFCIQQKHFKNTFLAPAAEAVGRQRRAGFYPHRAAS